MRWIQDLLCKVLNVTTVDWMRITNVIVCVTRVMGVKGAIPWWPGPSGSVYPYSKGEVELAESLPTVSSVLILPPVF